MWRTRRRLQQLEIEIAEASAERAELRKRLDWFEAIAEAAGAALPGTGPHSSGFPHPGLPGTVQKNIVPGRLPPNLLAASRDLRTGDVPVRLEVAGAEVVAIVGGPGDPQEWWTAIWRMVGPGTADPEEAPA